MEAYTNDRLLKGGKMIIYPTIIKAEDIEPASEKFIKEQEKFYKELANMLVEAYEQLNKKERGDFNDTIRRYFKGDVK